MSMNAKAVEIFLNAQEGSVEKLLKGLVMFMLHASHM